MAGNSVLNAAGRAKNDEFYTQLSDIEKEMRHYRNHFEDKTVLCNCDDPFESNFFKYFALKFNDLKLKKLIATSYAGSPITGTELPLFGDESTEQQRTPYKAVVTTVRDTTGDSAVGMPDVAELFKQGENKLTALQGNGDFRSDECLELLDEADIVVTNPPFSLFRKYVATLIDYKKKFIIIGNQNAISYKEIFRFIMMDRIWLGFTAPKEFIIPTDTTERKNTYIRDDGVMIAKFGNVCWFTNLDIKKRHEEMILFKRYSPENYPHYDNYDAIEVAKVDDIPCDYSGVMGVPITFLDKYNPEQFEILGITDRQNTSHLRTKKYTAKDSPKYNDLNARSVLRLKDGSYKQVYARLLIRNKHPEQPKEI